MGAIAFSIRSRRPLAGGESFGSVGPYQRLDGTVHFAADPLHGSQAAIVDLDLAPRDALGQVRWSADFTVLSPVDQGRGSGRLLFDVLNRGRRVALRLFNMTGPLTDHTAPLDVGDGFLMRHGFTVAWCGWQHDLPEVPGLMRMESPEAVAPTGPVTGRVMVTIQPNAPGKELTLSDREHQPYPAADLDDPEAVLLVRDHEQAPATRIPRPEWAFARDDGGQTVADAGHVYMAAGFEPGRIYQVIYAASGARVVGCGLLAARDLVSFLRYGPASAGNPCAGHLQRAYGFGASQSGRFLRQLLYLGLNEDEQGRPVFDGLMPHVAGGRRGEFNLRFGQPSNMAYQSVGTLFPFADTAMTDPVLGRTDGLLVRQGEMGQAPKVFLLNTSTEYWRGDASLLHTDLTGVRDVEPAANVRIYHFSGTQHGAGTLPLQDGEDGNRSQQPRNSIDYRPLLRAALIRLDRWASEGELPPPNRFPRLDDGTAVVPEETRAIFESIPGVGFPTHTPYLARLDFGPNLVRGVADKLPPDLGEPYPCMVPAVDADGNEVGGIKLPQVSVPLATHAGWNLRHPDMGAPDMILELAGSTIPFPHTQARREATGDPRPSIEERYPTKEAYLTRVRSAARALVDEGYLLAEDVAGVMGEATRRFGLLRYGEGTDG